MVYYMGNRSLIRLGSWLKSVQDNPVSRAFHHQLIYMKTFIISHSARIQSLVEIAAGALIGAGILMVLYFLGLIFSFLAPIATIAFVLGFTALAWKKTTHRLLVIGGLVSYVIAWVVVWTIGSGLESLALTVGAFGSWCTGAYMALVEKFPSLRITLPKLV
jgi:hypothetical protein